MPNHVSNRITVKSSSDDWKAEEAALEQIKVLMKTEDSPFDFNVLIPYPERFESLDDARAAAEKQPGVKWVDLPKDGYNQGGYEWCIANWGTKWNAYDIGFGYDSITFNTAWNTPRPIWLAISKHIPDVEMIIEYADEDKGRNCGVLTYQNGKLLTIITETAMRDPVLFARAIIAEQSSAEHYADYLKAQDQIKELEEQLASYRANMTAI